MFSDKILRSFADVNTYQIFVYGTLLKGGPNSHLLQKTTLVSQVAKTAETFYLISNETAVPPHSAYKYPYLLRVPVCPGQEPKNIIGEVYQVDATILENLDALEGHPHHYLRQQINVIIPSTSLSASTTECTDNRPSTQTLQCDTYILQNEETIAAIASEFASNPEGRDTGYKTVPNGDWRTFIGGY